MKVIVAVKIQGKTVAWEFPSKTKALSFVKDLKKKDKNIDYIIGSPKK